ncbi:Sodium leak channel non-selective protein [Thelohanellus kitauei]|uniref:Sodium leak channel non-selective protein n=1 Tax=Thelohanellus kitauei TaxID=669202 RepID=A0A0C2MI86_THEKT|nr:Sodium leak channel non-selective protein [Thelohanellus kitauei]
MPPQDWVVGEFLFPVLNLVAVVLNYFGYYQLDVVYALRVLRIISVHSFIFDYIKRILGNYVRFSASLVLAIAFLIVLTSLSLQLFTGIPTAQDPNTSVLEDFPTSFLNIFIIFLQGGAFGTMLGLAAEVSAALYFFVVLFFVGCHFFSNTIMMSVFITFILANLELTEDEIKEMQKEITVPFDPLDDYAGSSKETQVVRLSDEVNDEFVLPFRFKVFRFFKDSSPSVPIPIELRDSDTPSINRNFMFLYMKDDYPVWDERIYVPKNIRPGTDVYKTHFVTKNFGFNQDDFKPLNLNFEYPSVVEMMKILSAKSSPLHTPITEARKGAFRQIRRASSESATQSNEEKEIATLQKKISNFLEMRARLIETLREQHPLIDKSLFIFDKNNKIRKFCGLVLNSRYDNKDASFVIGNILESQSYFEWVMILLTLVSSVFMMLETAENMVFDQQYTTILEYVFVCIGVTEVILRMISQGLIFTPSAIFNDPSDILNVFVAIINVIHSFYFFQVSPSNKFINSTSYTYFAIFLRTARCIRPFRVVLISKDLFRVIVLLLGGWKNILKVLCLLLILLLFFSYFGYLSFKNRLTRCNDDQIESLNQCQGQYLATLSAVPVTLPTNSSYDSTAFQILVPRMNVSHSRFFFDDFVSAYLSSYIMMTLDSWDSGMAYFKACVGSWVTLYFYAYVFFANLIGVSMFIGVVCQSYNIKTGVALLTKDQRNWSDLTQRIDLTSPEFIPKRPLDVHKARLYDIIMSLPYRIFHSLVSCVSPTALLLYPLNEKNLEAEQYICYIIIMACHVYFLIDLMLKIVAFGFITYFRSLLSKCDTLLIVLTIIVAGLKLSNQFTGIVVLHYIIICSVTIQLILLSARWDALKNLMLTFIMSVVKSLTTITVMFIIMVVYALMGNVLFSRVKFGLTLNRYFNYRTSYNALFMLFILATGDNWSAYLFDSAIQEPMCTYDPDFPVRSDCGGKIAAIIYFITYLLIIQQIVLNLFIANVLSNFAVFCASDEVSGRFKPSDISSYIKLWNKFDKKQKSKISRNYARMLCLEYFYLKGYTSPDDWFIMAQLYEEIDRFIKESYMNQDDVPKEEDSFKTHGTISFRELMLILATRLTDIKVSFKTNELLTRMRFEEDISENVSSSLIWKWYKYMKSMMKNETKNLDDSKTIRLPTERIDLNSSQEKDMPKCKLKFDPESLKKQLDNIKAETPTTDPETIDAFCNWWHDEYLALNTSKQF